MENDYYFDLLINMTTDQITNETRYIFTPETYFGEGFGFSLEEFKTTILHHKIDSLLEKNPKIQLVSGSNPTVFTGQTTLTPTTNFVRNGVWVDFYNSA